MLLVLKTMFENLYSFVTAVYFTAYTNLTTDRSSLPYLTLAVECTILTADLVSVRDLDNNMHRALGDLRSWQILNYSHHKHS